MHRRFSTLLKTSSTRSESSAAPQFGDDAESKVSTVTSTTREGDNAQLAPPSLKVKHVDYYYSWWTRSWKYRNTSAKVVVEAVPVGAGMSKDGNDPWKDFLFVVVRTIPRQEAAEVTVKYVVKSPYIVKACKEVIQTWPGVSWNADPLEIDPEIFLVFYDQFIAYRDLLNAKKNPTQEDNYIAKSVDVLIDTLANDFKSTLSTLQRLTSHAEIQWDLLPYIFVPRTVFVARCVVSGEPRLFKLRHWIRCCFDGKPVFQLTLESVDAVDRSGAQSVAVGRVLTNINIGLIRGIVKIQTLDAYPIRFFVGENGMREEGLKEMAIERGKKWFSLFGVHHVQYDGVAALRAGGSVVRHHVKSRIMVDRATFKRFNQNYYFSKPVPRIIETDGEGNQDDSWASAPQSVTPAVPLETYSTASAPAPTTQNDARARLSKIRARHSPAVSNAGGTQTGVVMESNKGPFEDISMEDYTEEDYLLASTIVYGFSLADKIWLEFSVSLITPVIWNQAAFANLVLPPGRKDLLKSLVEAHHKQLNFDDFIKGKGHGLVVNMYGPPGVGKTFSAEATSEHVQRPLYVVGAGDLGTDPRTLDLALEKVFDLATVWKAIVLIDEADVFLEQRTLHDLERNAMVAVFLRHVEYYRGILFLTTNRVQAFDEAFLSRIHVALHFTELSLEAKVQVWKAFLQKVGAWTEEGGGAGGITEEQVGELARREVNGRQIKNAVRTAQSLAAAKEERFGFGHVVQTLDAMEEFTREFERAVAA